MREKYEIFNRVVVYRKKKLLITSFTDNSLDVMSCRQKNLFKEGANEMTVEEKKED